MADSSSDGNANGLYWTGVALSVTGNSLIAISLATQKYAHNSNTAKKPFVQLPLWWVGLLLQIFGELGNLLSYGMAPAAVVAPVGSIAVVINQVIAVMFLKETFRSRDVAGIFCVACGVSLIISAVPDSGTVLTANRLLSADFFFAPRSCAYLASIGVLVLFLVLYIEPRKAHDTVLVWLLLCSCISSVTVIACRGWSQMLSQIGEDCQGVDPCSQTVGHWLFWMLLIVVVGTAVWSTGYLNKAMMHYGSTEVVPVYFCTFTFASITGSGIVYNELAQIDAVHGMMFGAGLLLAGAGVGIVMSGRTPNRKTVESVMRKTLLFEALDDDETIRLKANLLRQHTMRMSFTAAYAMDLDVRDF